MSFMDTLKGLVDKGKHLAGQHPDQVDQTIDKAGDIANEKTGGKYAGHVDKAQDAAKKYLHPETPGQPEAPKPPETPGQPGAPKPPEQPPQ